MVAAGLSAWAHLKIVNVTEFYLWDMYNSKDIQVASQIMALSFAYIKIRYFSKETLLCHSFI